MLHIHLRLKEIPLKFVLFMLCFSLLSGCSLKEAADNNFKAKTEITPFAPSKKLTERFGNKVTIKIPLAESSLGYVDIDEIIGEITGKPKLDRDTKNFIERLRDGFIMSVGRLGMKFGLFNKIKISSFFDFDYINQDFITSAKVKRVFFTTENCRLGENDCNNKYNKVTNFTLVDKLFVNLSNYQDEYGTPEEEQLANIEGDGVEFVSNSEFRKETIRSFSQSRDDIALKIKAFKNEEGLGVLNGEANSINLVKFTSPVPIMNLKFEDVDSSQRSIHLAINEKQQRKVVHNYLKSDFFKGYIVSAQRVSDGIIVNLEKDITPQHLSQKISSDQSPLVANMVIFRLNSGFKQAKKLFMDEKLKRFVKDTSIIGKSVYVELKDSSFRTPFLNAIGKKNDYRSSNLDIYSIDTCIYANCIEVDANDFNLVPILAVNPKLQIDTFLSLKTLGSVDFKYNGFIEVELELDLPL